MTIITNAQPHHTAKDFFLAEIVPSYKTIDKTKVLDYTFANNFGFILLENGLDSVNGSFLRNVYIFKVKSNNGRYVASVMNDEENPFGGINCPKKLYSRCNSLMANSIDWRTRCERYTKEQEDKRKIVKLLKDRLTKGIVLLMNDNTTVCFYSHDSRTRFLAYDEHNEQISCKYTDVKNIFKK